MTCKNCVNHDECLRKSQDNPDHAHRMWMCDFWDNAEERCNEFEDASKERGEDG